MIKGVKLESSRSAIESNARFASNRATSENYNDARILRYEWLAIFLKHRRKIVYLVEKLNVFKPPSYL